MIKLQVLELLDVSKSTTYASLLRKKESWVFLKSVD